MIDETGLLAFLRYCNALDEKRALMVIDLARFLNEEVSSVRFVVTSLSNKDKVAFRKGRIWLTPLGFSSSLKDYS